MRLRRIYGESIAKGAVADGPVLFEADMGYQIDNMEGLDVWPRADGAEMVSLMSDDNHSILQRNLYLEFMLHGRGRAARPTRKPPVASEAEGSSNQVGQELTATRRLRPLSRRSAGRGSARRPRSAASP